jgi:hypothetical protein
MKHLFIALLLLPLFSTAQKEANYVGGDHGKLVVIIGSSPNSVLNYIGSFATDNLGMAFKDGPAKELPMHITLPFGPKISASEKRGFTTHYTIDKNGAIAAFILDGNFNDVLNFFIQYWPTTISFDDAAKQQTAVKYLVSDKIILTLHVADKTGSIQVISNN